MLCVIWSVFIGLSTLRKGGAAHYDPGDSLQDQQGAQSLEQWPFEKIEVIELKGGALSIVYQG